MDHSTAHLRHLGLMRGRPRKPNRKTENIATWAGNSPLRQCCLVHNRDLTSLRVRNTHRRGGSCSGSPEGGTRDGHRLSSAAIHGVSVDGFRVAVNRRSSGDDVAYGRENARHFTPGKMNWRGSASIRCARSAYHSARAADMAATCLASLLRSIRSLNRFDQI
jgi:hypothetical protein